MDKFDAIENPLYLKLSKYLREKILGNAYKPGEKLPSERELSDETGLSRVTVNKALTALVDEGWLFRKRGLGTYVASEAARTTVRLQGKTKNIGVVYLNGALFSGEPFYSKIVYGIEKEAIVEDHHVLLTTVEEDPNIPSSLQTALRARKIDGAIVVGKIPDEYINTLAHAKLPFVLVDYDIPNTPYSRVLIDNRHGIELVVDYLYQMGHRRIGLIGGPDYLPSIVERVDAFNKCIGERHCLSPEAWRVEGALKTASGYQACRQILEQSERPTAIVSVNDEMAIGAMSCCQELGIRIPEDLSLVGFDNIEWSQHCHPALTTVNVPKEKMGKQSVMLLMDIIPQSGGDSTPNEDYGHTVRIKTKLVTRKSVASVL